MAVPNHPKLSYKDALTQKPDDIAKTNSLDKAVDETATATKLLDDPEAPALLTKPKVEDDSWGKAPAITVNPNADFNERMASKRPSSSSSTGGPRTSQTLVGSASSYRQLGETKGRFDPKHSDFTISATGIVRNQGLSTTKYLNNGQLVTEVDNLYPGAYPINSILEMNSERREVVFTKYEFDIVYEVQTTAEQDRENAERQRLGPAYKEKPTVIGVLESLGRNFAREVTKIRVTIKLPARANISRSRSGGIWYHKHLNVHNRGQVPRPVDPLSAHFMHLTALSQYLNACNKLKSIDILLRVQGVAENEMPLELSHVLVALPLLYNNSYQVNSVKYITHDAVERDYPAPVSEWALEYCQTEYLRLQGAEDTKADDTSKGKGISTADK